MTFCKLDKVVHENWDIEAVNSAKLWGKYDCADHNDHTRGLRKVDYSA